MIYHLDQMGRATNKGFETNCSGKQESLFQGIGTLCILDEKLENGFTANTADTISG